MTPVKVPAWYEATLRLYPRSFRAEYADDMRLMFTDLAAGERGLPLFGRIARDVAVSVPRLRREERQMKGKVILAVVVVLLIGFGIAGTGEPVLGGLISLGALGLIVGASALIARGGASTEDVYRNRFPLWVIAAGFVALYSIFSMVDQYVGDPTAGNLTGMIVGSAFAAAIGGGIMARAAGRRWGHWLVIGGCAPMLGLVWFIPVPVAALTAIVGSLAEWMKSRRNVVPAV